MSPIMGSLGEIAVPALPAVVWGGRQVLLRLVARPAPGGGRGTQLALERAAERGLGIVPDVGGNGGDVAAARAQKVRGELEAPAGQILHRWLPDQASEPLGESRTRQPDRACEFLHRPRMRRPRQGRPLKPRSGHASRRSAAFSSCPGTSAPCADRPACRPIRRCREHSNDDFDQGGNGK